MSDFKFWEIVESGLPHDEINQILGELENDTGRERFSDSVTN